MIMAILCEGKFQPYFPTAIYLVLSEPHWAHLAAGGVGGDECGFIRLGGREGQQKERETERKRREGKGKEERGRESR